ncbi:hypothetical protein B0H11DRAFT_1852265 [Mycena galericulata]|nr:hypothetical protein B0H11DRAFT_1852265 [Mycena galericulata]
MLTFGNYTAVFRRIYEMAMAPDSPMYERDVKRLDRQDDAAATRLFCAETLAYLSEHFPEYIGEIVYLFIFGELVDAYQNREISHAERIKMALRARYFLDAWEQFLNVAGCKPAQYFLSREAVDIARILVEGIIGLIIVHRDHVPGSFPLLPWFHSSEPCEHTFGDARKIVKDFAMLELIFMIPKLRVTMREAVVAGKSSDPKARAQGYSHTYYDNRGANLKNLAVCPSDAEIKAASELAAAEAEALISLLGLVPEQLHRKKAAPLPGIAAWYDDDDENTAHDEEFDDNDEIRPSDAEELQVLLDQQENAPIRSTRMEQEVMSLTCASIAVTADEHMRFQQMDEELADGILSEEYLALQEAMSELSTSEPLTLHGAASTLDLSPLVEQRRRHQTRQAEKCSRTKTSKTATAPDSEESIRRQILRKFHEILKEDQSRALGSTVERQARWNTGTTVAGNAANAAAAAATLAKGAATRRVKLFKDAKVPHFPLVSTGGISAFKKLAIGDFGIVWTETGLMIAQVQVMYSKGGGKNGKHNNIDDHTNLSGISHLGTQVYEPFNGRHFRAVTEATASLQTKQFRILAPLMFLCRLSAPPITTATGLEIAAADPDLFRDLSKNTALFDKVMKQSKSRKKTGEAAEEDFVVEDSTLGF